jgi:hypothetical protein
MITGTLTSVSRLETFELIIELIDDETDELIDVSDVEAISVSILERCGYCSALLTATLGNGIETTQTGIITVTFTVDQMRTLRAGTYQVFGTLTKDGETAQIINATLPVTGPDAL